LLSSDTAIGNPIVSFELRALQEVLEFVPPSEESSPTLSPPPSTATAPPLLSPATADDSSAVDNSAEVGVDGAIPPPDPTLPPELEEWIRETIHSHGESSILLGDQKFTVYVRAFVDKVLRGALTDSPEMQDKLIVWLREANTLNNKHGEFHLLLHHLEAMRKADWAAGVNHVVKLLGRCLI
jgi:hypothetical protein